MLAWLDAEQLEFALRTAENNLLIHNELFPDGEYPLGQDDDDFTVISQVDIISIFEEITGVLTVFLGSIAAISLLVGGIGIMNIMLVSVTERTREIGVRKAVGVKRRDILLQFLVEAVALSLIGGFVGIGLGRWARTLSPGWQKVWRRWFR